MVERGEQLQEKLQQEQDLLCLQFQEHAGLFSAS